MKILLTILLTFFVTGCMTVTENTEPKLESNPIEKAESRITLGLSYLENGDMVKARENLEKALQHAPEYYRAMLSIAHYYDKVGEINKAYDAYDEALSEHDDNGYVLNNYGAFLCKNGQYQKADDYFNQAIEASQYYLISTSYENAGLCALKYRNYTKAKHYFSRALDHDPQRVRSLLHLAKLEIDSGKLNQARVRLVTFHNDFGQTNTSLKLLANLETRAGNSAMAMKYHSLINR